MSAPEKTGVSADERLARVRLKIDRAQTHVDELSREINAFLATNPYRVIKTLGPPISYELSHVSEVPAGIGVVFGDAIHNLRSALDHVQRQLALTALGREILEEETQFVIRNEASQCKIVLQRMEKKGLLRRDAFDALMAVEAFKGGKGKDLWVLNRLDAIDKHRVILAAGGSYRSFNIGSVMTMHMNAAIDAENIALVARGELPMDQIHVFEEFMRPSDIMCPLRLGEVLFIGADGMDVEKDFRFDVALNEPEIVKQQPLLEALKCLTDAVVHAVESLRPCLQ